MPDLGDHSVGKNVRQAVSGLGRAVPHRRLLAVLTIVAMSVGLFSASLPLNAAVAGVEDADSPVVVNKSAADVSYSADGTSANLTWTVTVTNNGNKTLTGGEFTDQLSQVATDVKVETLMGDMFAADIVGPLFTGSDAVLVLTDSSGKPWRVNNKNNTVGEVTGANDASFAPNLISPGFLSGAVFVLTDTAGTAWQITNKDEQSKASKVEGLGGATFAPNMVGPELSSSNFTTFMVTDTEGRLWKFKNDGTTPRAVASRVATDASFAPNLVSPRISETSSFVLADTSGKLWQIKGNGAVSEVTSTVEAWNSASFASNLVSQRFLYADARSSLVLTDTSGALWHIKGDGKAYKVTSRDSAWSGVTFEANLSGPGFYTYAGLDDYGYSFVLTDTQGTAWLVTHTQDGGVASKVTGVDGVSFKLKQPCPALSSSAASFMMTDDTGALWRVTGAGAASKVTSTDDEWHGEAFDGNLVGPSLPSGSSFVLTDATGILWRVASDGTARKVTSTDVEWDSEVFAPNLISPGLSSSAAFVLTDSAAVPWLVTGDGTASKVEGGPSGTTMRTLEEIPPSKDVTNDNGDTFTKRAYSIPNIPPIEGKNTRELKVTATVPRPTKSEGPLVIVNQAFYNSENTPAGDIDLPVVPEVETARAQLEGLTGNESCPVGSSANAQCDQVPAVIEVQPIDVVMTSEGKTEKTPTGQEPTPVLVLWNPHDTGYAATTVTVKATNTSDSGSGVVLNNPTLVIEKLGADADLAEWTWSTSSSQQGTGSTASAALGPGESITFTGKLPGAGLDPETVYQYQATVTAGAVGADEEAPKVFDSDTWAAQTSAKSTMTWVQSTPGAEVTENTEAIPGTPGSSQTRGRAKASGEVPMTWTLINTSERALTEISLGIYSTPVGNPVTWDTGTRTFVVKTEACLKGENASGCEDRIDGSYGSYTELSSALSSINLAQGEQLVITAPLEVDKPPISGAADACEVHRSSLPVTATVQTSGTPLKTTLAANATASVSACSFEFAKVDEVDTSKKLNGAEFVLFQAPDDASSTEINSIIDPTAPPEGWTPVDIDPSQGLPADVDHPVVSGKDVENGKVEFTALASGITYRLVETKTPPPNDTSAPDGYVLPAGQWNIKLDSKTGAPEITSVSGAGIEPPNIESGAGKASTEPLAFSGNAESGYTLGNRRKTSLPSSGRNGLMTLVLLGAALAVAGCAWRLADRRKPVGRHAS